MISRKADYAIRTIFELAVSDGAPVAVRTISENQGIPYAFARRIQHALIKAGLVKSKRGSTGGVVLAKPADDITLLDIVEAIDGKISSNACTHESTPCNRDALCPFHLIWKNLDKYTNDYLASVLISEIIEGKTSSLKTFP